MDYYSTIATYNQWMNQKLYAVCAEIPDDDRKSDRGAFFNSVHGTLNHILVADRIWLGRFTQQPFVAKLDGELDSDFSELRLERERLDLTIIDWAQDLTPDWLNADFTHTNNAGITRTLPHWLFVTHMFNHQTHHRGQLTTLLNQMGYQSGVTDLHTMPSLQQVET
jgi:uncharacterized damage-inducible protein DinB